MGVEFFTQSKPRSLPVILLADVSSSMGWNEVGGVKAIDALNKAIEDMLNSLKQEDVIGAEIQLEIITFGGDGAEIHTPLQSVKNVEWKKMAADGFTPMGGAFALARELIEDTTRIPHRSYTPAIILISDGEPNDNWAEELDKFLNSERAKKADRMAMFIGADSGEDVLRDFLADNNKRVFRAEDAAKIYEFFKFVTMSVTTRAVTKDKQKNEEAEEFFSNS